MDIDKTYIMGQSFVNGVYLGWSPLFDYTSLKTLAASKTLPLPTNTVLVTSSDPKYNIDTELLDIINTFDRAIKIKKIGDLIRKVVKTNKGFYNYTVDDKEGIITLILKHERFKIQQEVAELTYKNIASANIFNISHSIRNRDLAYSEITMSDLRNQANNTPKGKQTKALNAFNPMTKYIMQWQNLVGKDVIGIAANGEKVWFNLTYYYHDILRNGNDKDKTYLKMSHVYERISGRSKNQIESKTIKHIPDISKVDLELTSKIKKLFYDNIEIDIDDVYVDLLISQLLSAATDNAKELILAKINAGTNLAKYHIHLMIMGFSLDDIVAFMTSPVVELIDSQLSPDLYNYKESYMKSVLNMLRGKVSFSKLLKKRSIEYSEDMLAEMAEMAAERAEAEAELIEETGRGFNKEEHLTVITLLGDNYKKVNPTNLDNFFSIYILSRLGFYDHQKNNLIDQSLEKNENLDKYRELKNLKLSDIKTSNFNIKFVFKQIDSLVDNILLKIQEHTKATGHSYDIIDYFLDLQEFEKLTELADETSTFASAYLKLNQGIPQTEEDLIEHRKKMIKAITSRESLMGIKNHFKTFNNFYLGDEIEKFFKDDIRKKQEDILQNNQGTKVKLISALDIAINKQEVYAGDSTELKELKNLITKIRTNNPSLDLNYIYQVLHNSITTEIYGNFSLDDYLLNKLVVLTNNNLHMNSRTDNIVEYRELAADYYNLIKASWNILDAMNRIPTYKQILDLFNYTIVQRKTFAIKSTLIDELLTIPEINKMSLDKKQFKNIKLYADKMIINSFLLLLDPITLPDEGNVLNSNYLLIKKDILELDSLSGIDSLKYYIENDFLAWMKNKFKDDADVQPLLQQLTLGSNYGKPLLRTVLNLFDTDLNLANRDTFNKMIVACEKLQDEKFAEGYTVLDMLMLYNLAVNGTKLGGKYLTGLFGNFSKPGTVLFNYYKFLGDIDFNSQKNFIMPTKTDLLIALAPTVSSEAALSFRTEPFVKVKNPVTGFDVFEKDGRSYRDYPLLDFGIDLALSPSERQECLYNYSNSMLIFPQLNKKLAEFKFLSRIEKQTITVDELTKQLAKFIKEKRVLIYREC